MPTSSKATQFASALGALRKELRKVFVFSVFLNLTVLVVPLYMLQVYDRVLTSQSVDTLYLLTALAFGMLGAMALVEMARAWVLVQSGTRLDGALNSLLFELALKRRLEGESSTVSQPLRDLEIVRSFLTGPGLPALFDAPWIPLYLAILFLMHPIFGIIGTFGAIVILGLAVLSNFTTKNATRESSNAHLTSNSFLDSLSRTSEAVHAMGMVRHLNKLWLRAHEAGVAWHAVAAERSAVITSFTKAFRMSLQVAILGSGAWLAINNITSPGVMIAASIIMSRALAPAEAAIANWRNLIAARQTYHRLKAMIGEEPKEAKHRMNLPAPTGRVEVDKVFFRHPGDNNWLLQNLSFALAPGEALGIVGPSGIGKSSLIRLLLGLTRPNFGTVRLDGAEVADWSYDELGPSVGYVPQDVELLIGSVAHNIGRFTGSDPKKVARAAKFAGAHEMILRLPNGYDTLLGEGGVNVSGGQRQRIALARALYDDPKYIVLDEPNSNLDLEGQEALKRTLAALNERVTTVIIVTHRASSITSTAKLLVLLPGHEYLFGPREAVLARLNGSAREKTSNSKQAALAS
jgi:PrtD family type I secretion system ABC transporter